jgi:hypothetical protein
MARLTNVNSGAIVEVRDEKVEAMGAEWQPAETEKKAPAKKSASSKSSK